MSLNKSISIIISLLKYLDKDSIQETDIKFIKQQIDVLFYLLPLPNYFCIPNQLERLTINERIKEVGNRRISEIRHLKYPPTTTKYGRCNVLDNPVLYGSFNLFTILDEIKPETGKLLTHSIWKVKEGIKLKMCPIVFEDNDSNTLSSEIRKLHNDYISNLSYLIQETINLHISFFVKCFSKNVEELNHYDYFLSAYISYKIFNIHNANYDGIIYPSVGSNLNFSNMAIRPSAFDSKFEIVEVLHQQNQIEHNKNGLNVVISRATKFDLEKGIIIWDN